MRPAGLFLLLGLSAYVADPGDPLHVLRVTPAGETGPGTVITVAFDRPVAGSLDRTVDAELIFSIEPQVEGRVEWRDPVTLRFTPSRLLEPGSSYQVTISNDFSAMDGSRLPEPFRFSFRVRGPEVLTSSLSAQDSRFLPPDARFRVVTSAPVDPAVVARVALVEFPATCPVRMVRLKVTGQREITSQDRWEYREAGGWDRNREADPLRRLVELTPGSPLPHGCEGSLVLPSRLDLEASQGEPRRYDFATYGDFRITHVGCPWEFCPTGPVQVEFSTPVKGAELLRHLRTQPAMNFTVSDTSAERARWSLNAELAPRTGYAVIADSALRDVFGQPLTGNPVGVLVTTGYAPAVDYEYGRLLVEREGYRTLAVRYVNVDTLVARIAPVPDSLEAEFLARSQWGWDDVWGKVASGATVRRIPVRHERDRTRIFGVPLPVANAARPGARTLLAVRITSPAILPVDSGAAPPLGPLALVQVTDLAVHARIGVQQGAVWVTGVHDGLPRAGARVALRDIKGAVLASGTTDSSGLARLSGYQAVPNAYEEGQELGGNLEGYVEVTLGADRALVGINQYDPDLSPWRFDVWSAWDEQRLPLAAAVFTERGIYRPGEPVYAKAIVRRGNLGSLTTPTTQDSIRWVFHDREEGTLLERVTPLSPFGTSELRLPLPADLPLGEYQVAVQYRWRNVWRELATTSYRVAEYRPPEFLVDVAVDSAARYPGDSLTATIESRYLFGAPMARAAVGWTARLVPIEGWELSIPGAEGYHTGETAFWWEDENRSPAVITLASGTDTLDNRGRLTVRAGITGDLHGRPARASVQAVVTDVNRQAVGATASVIVHPAEFYLAARAAGQEYFWKAGTPVRVVALAVRPDGGVVPGVRVRGAIIRREWHQVHRERGGMAEQVGDWVMDTVARCDFTTAGEPSGCGFTPPEGGIYVVALTAADPKGRAVSTSFVRWASGSEWVPWNDENRFKMDVVADRERYSVGDTATVLFASPFTDAEAWITMEREGIIEQRRMRLTSGSTLLRFPITEAFAPNAYVSILVARGRSARPGPLDDPGRPTIRVGYAQLRVTPEVKRLTVAVEPLQAEYRPGDTARVRLRVRDRGNRGQQSEVALWAVDEGVLALTGYQTPDPLDLIYGERGLGVRLASNMVSVAPQVPEGEKGRRNPGGGGGGENTEVLRSRFQTTAFFLGSVVTDSSGNAIAAARLPDNLTTFRVMAVAVTAGDRYGHGQSSMLVTRPLLARPALPRFLRADDQFSAGVVVNQRAGGTPQVTVTARAEGARLLGEASRTATLEEGRGREVRFSFRGLPGDTAQFRFDVRGAGDADAVLSRLPVREAFHPRLHTIAGLLHDSATVEFTLPADIDPARSRLILSLGASPLAVVRGAFQTFRVYPYYCTEQVVSSALPLLALLRAEQRMGDSTLAPPTARQDLQQAVATIVRRQREDGGIGYWSAADWTTPWLTAYAGTVLLGARALGVPVSDTVLGRIGDYLVERVRNPGPVVSPVVHWYDRTPLTLAEQVAAVDLLSRLGRPDAAAENELLRRTPQMDWVDRVRLARVLARRKDRAAAQGLLSQVTAPVRVEGRVAVVPDSLQRGFYFGSRLRSNAELLMTVLAVDSVHPLVGPLVESLVQAGRGASHWVWSTQDMGALVQGLASYEERQRRAVAGGLVVRAGGKIVLRTDSLAGLRDSAVSLRGLVSGSGETRRVRVNLTGRGGGPPAFYYLSVEEVPRTRPVRPDEQGIAVERWYESYPDGKPVTEVRAGDLVRVRLRVTVPATRHFVVLDDALPAGLEAIDLSLRTAAPPGVGLATPLAEQVEGEGVEQGGHYWYYGSWDSGWWSPFDHRELRDDRVVYFATILWKGSYSATYLARATTPGVFVRPPAFAEEMYNPAVQGRTDGGVFTVREP